LWSFTQDEPRIYSSTHTSAADRTYSLILHWNRPMSSTVPSTCLRIVWRILGLTCSVDLEPWRFLRCPKRGRRIRIAHRIWSLEIQLSCLWSGCPISQVSDKNSHIYTPSWKSIQRNRIPAYPSVGRIFIKHI